MIRKAVLFSIGAVVAGLVQPVIADDDDVERLRKKLEEMAVVEKKVMVPMRDGVRLATDVYPTTPHGPRAASTMTMRAGECRRCG